MVCSLSLNQVHIFSTSNVGHKFPFCDAAAGESGMDPGHQDNCAWRTAAMFRYSQMGALPIYGRPFLKKHRLLKPPLQRFIALFEHCQSYLEAFLPPLSPYC